mmetsp:Transcript_23283/g.49156  ORF Transcript_23283/g.49156 Transcript_23283/m.49156 type:complete len:224 (-) Transcript_23283:309-980(-)
MLSKKLHHMICLRESRHQQHTKLHNRPPLTRLVHRNALLVKLHLQLLGIIGLSQYHFRLGDEAAERLFHLGKVRLGLLLRFRVERRGRGRRRSLPGRFLRRRLAHRILPRGRFAHPQRNGSGTDRRCRQALHADGHRPVLFGNVLDLTLLRLQILDNLILLISSVGHVPSVVVLPPPALGDGDGGTESAELSRIGLAALILVEIGGHDEVGRLVFDGEEGVGG